MLLDHIHGQLVKHYLIAIKLLFIHSEFLLPSMTVSFCKKLTVSSRFCLLSTTNQTTFFKANFDKFYCLNWKFDSFEMCNAFLIHG